MRRLIVYISVSSLFLILSGFSAVNERTAALSTPLRIDASKSIAAKASLLYDLMELDTKGLSKEAFDYAYKGYQQLLEKGTISRSEYLTICDLSQSSKKRRLYLIDIANSKVVLNTYVAHGRNSGGEYARRFSNKTSSHQSSLGFYITRNTYSGEHGLSLRLEGLEPGFNDKAYRRAIVVHGASYIGEGSAGRSYGCPAVPAKESKTLINTIKNGTCLFIYHPQVNYLKGSKILNG
ncbi:MAG: murein L,D-transpeptidase catalytic domain family protein [Chitinophagaceae bacterium]|nr:murein L,D-transpeptidase catalytic domain family protein [Chitinophagaceae bacterium]